MKGALFFGLGKSNDSVRSTFQKDAQFFQCQHRNAAVISETVHGVLVNSHVNEIIL